VNLKSKFFILSIPIFMTGCSGSLFNINLQVIGEQTALERQVLGSYADIGRDLGSYSSVRGVDPNGDLTEPPEVTTSQEAAFAALRNQEYNSDDVRSILNAQIAGTNSEGFLEQRNNLPDVYFLTEDQVEQLIEEENNDRRVLFDRLKETVTYSPDQESEIISIFATINQEKAPNGTLIENEDGDWVTK